MRDHLHQDIDLALLGQRIGEDEDCYDPNTLQIIIKKDFPWIENISAITLKKMQKQLLKNELLFIQDLYRLFTCQYLLAKKNVNAKKSALEELIAISVLDQTLCRIKENINTMLKRLDENNPLYNWSILITEQLEAEYVKIFLQKDHHKKEKLSQCVGSVLNILERAVNFQHEGTINNEMMGTPAQFLTENAPIFSGAPRRGKQTLGGLFIAFAIAATIFGMIALAAATSAALPLTLGCVGIGLIGSLCAIKGGMTIYKNRAHGFFSSLNNISTSAKIQNLSPDQDKSIFNVNLS